MTRLPLHTRVLALVGVLAAAVLLVGTQLVARGVLLGDDSASASDAKTASAATPAKTVTRAANKPAPVKNAAPKAAATAPRWLVKLRKSGLPPAVVRELREHRVVVVSLFSRAGAVDRLAAAEARAGAKRARVGFVSVNIVRERQARPVARKLGAMDAPAILIYRRPARLVFELEGFADLRTVEQAAVNARA